MAECRSEGRVFHQERLRYGCFGGTISVLLEAGKQRKKAYDAEADIVRLPVADRETWAGGGLSADDFLW